MSSSSSTCASTPRHSFSVIPPTLHFSKSQASDLSASSSLCGNKKLEKLDGRLHQEKQERQGTCTGLQAAQQQNLPESKERNTTPEDDANQDRELWPRSWIDGIVEGGHDPQHWSTSFKASVNMIYCIMILSTTYASSAFAPSAPHVAEYFGISEVVSMLGMSMYVLGFALGPLLFGPASELYGRKPVYCVAFIAMTIFQVGVAVSASYPALVVLRFFAGACGSSALNNVASSIVDMTCVRDRMRFNIAYRLVSFGGPTLGPLIGTFLSERIGWRVNLGVLPVFSFVVLVVYALVVPETFRPVLERRAEKRRAAQGSMASSEQGAVAMTTALATVSLLERYGTALKRPFVFLITEPVIIVVSIYTSVLYGLLYGTLGAFPYVWQHIRQRSPEYASVTYLSLLGGFSIGALLIVGLQDRQFKREYDEQRYTPESRIGPATWIGFLVPVGLIIFAWTAPYDKLQGTTDVHYVVPCFAMVLFAIGMQLIFNSWLSYAADCYGSHSASAMAACTFSRSLFGAAFPLLMRPALRASSVQLVFSVFAGVSFVLSFGSILFVRYGAQLRARSIYAKTV